jgi:hypothetical protein
MRALPPHGEWHQRKWRLAKAQPDPDFRYRSNATARFSSAKAAECLGVPQDPVDDFSGAANQQGP